MTLRLDWCSHEAAKYAVEHWHYSRKMPVGKHARIGVWEEDRYVGVILFAPGSNNRLGAPYGLTQFECCELIRVALCDHKTSVSRMLAIAVRMIHRTYSRLRLIVSFADPNEGHHGGIYQASGWIHNGTAGPMTKYLVNGTWYHERSCRKSSEWSPVRGLDIKMFPSKTTTGRYRYLYPLDAAMRAQLRPLAKPYPRRQPLESEGPPNQGGIEGAAMRPVGSNAAIEAVPHGA